ncbi:hypothetical protein J6590_080133 [Homalodisca vitripennis]|nr:hypothetical protein J6590_080133 [Homalodisca vitripennis]
MNSPCYSSVKLARHACPRSPTNAYGPKMVRGPIALAEESRPGTNTRMVHADLSTVGIDSSNRRNIFCTVRLLFAQLVHSRLHWRHACALGAVMRTFLFVYDGGCSLETRYRKFGVPETTLKEVLVVLRRLSDIIFLIGVSALTAHQSQSARLSHVCGGCCTERGGRAGAGATNALTSSPNNPFLICYLISPLCGSAWSRLDTAAFILAPPVRGLATLQADRYHRHSAVLWGGRSRHFG